MNDPEPQAGLMAGVSPDAASGAPEAAPEPDSPQRSAPAPAVAAAGAVSAQAQEAPGHFGTLLRQARESAGVGVPALAQRLRLHVKQVEALERGDLEALPSVIYVRGFLRSCARELGIDAAPLLADLELRAGVQPDLRPETHRGSMPMSRFGDGSRLLIVGGLALLLVAGLLGIWIPRHNANPPAASVVMTPPPPTAAPEPAADGTAGAGVPPAPAAEAGPADASASRVAPAAPVPAPLRPAARQPATAAQPGPGDATNEVPAPIEAPALAALPPPVDPNALVLSVHATSWVEVGQANGTTIFSQICLPGSEYTIRGVPPLRVVIGNAAAVEAHFRGAAIDLQPHANANGVARFTLQ